ncbi:MAG: hypothetical protein JSU81_01840 [Candidatus Coatesbacteria bacterium]|nr:MAG: hypothetical protein JSU81_01840 [Candidatus Coatesbacteria bacterium]
MIKPFRLGSALTSGTAIVAVLLSCAAPAPAPREYYAVREGGDTVGRLARGPTETREDAAGPFYVTPYRLRLRRWVAGRGVEVEEVSVVAARRRGRPAYYFRGRWPGGDFVYRAGASWRLTLRDEFGNVAAVRGSEAPAAVTFRGLPLPLATAVPPPRPRRELTTLELTSGRVRRCRGTGDGRRWVGWGPSSTQAFAFDADGAVHRYADGDGLSVEPTATAPTIRGVWRRTAKPVLLPDPPGLTEPISLPLAARLSTPLRPDVLSRPGQTFVGDVAGRRARGTFGLAAAEQPPLREPPPPFAPPGGEPYPKVEAPDELERLAAYYRAEGKTVRHATGLGLFAGNVLARYSWLEVDGEPVAAPGLPLPRVRVTLALAAEPAEVLRFALLPDPESKGRNVGPAEGGVPALLAEAELFYEAFYAGAPAGALAVAYERGEEGPPSWLAYGEILGREVEAGAAGDPLGREAPFAKIGPASPVLEFLSLGGVVAASPGAPVPAEFCFPLGREWVRARRRGVAAVVVGPAYLRCQLYVVDPGGYRACYTPDGLLTRLTWGSYEMRLKSYTVAARAGRSFAERAPTPSPPAEEEAVTP